MADVRFVNRSIKLDVVVAPVGEQPAAVLAPLLTLRRCLDVQRMILVASSLTQWQAAAIRVALLAEDDGLALELISDQHLDALQDMQAHEHRCLLINGGRWETIAACRETLFAGGDPVYAWSRDHTLYLIDDQSVRFWAAPVTDPGLENLLALNSATLTQAGALRGINSSDDVLPAVDVTSSGGFLYAAINASNWTQTEYRMYALRRRWLQSMGLDSRRLLLRHLPRSLRRPAMEDGIPFERGSEGYTHSKWLSEVASGEVSGRPERQRDEPPGRGLEVTLGSGWDGRPMVAVMGTNPGTTLRSVWAARPERLLLLYDAEHPVAARAAGLLATDPGLGCPIEPLPITSLRVDQLPTLVAERLGDRASLDSRAGDKQTKLLLSALHLPAPKSDGDTPPLSTWVRMHAPRSLGEALEQLLPSAQDCAAAAAVIADMAATTDRNHWDDLSRRISPPCVHRARDVLRTTAQTFDLGDQFVCSELPDAWNTGKWFERVCTVVLAGVMDEVLANVHYREAEAAAERDELDIVGRHNGVYSHWSCKTTGGGRLYTYLREACGQAERLLGTGARAVLVVPRHPRQESVWLRAGIGHIVDSRLLADPEALRKFVTETLR